QAGDVVSVRETFAQAAAIAHTIAAHTSDESLRATFLDSSAIREVLDGGGRSESVLKRNGTIKPSGKFFSFEGTYSPQFRRPWCNTHRLIAQNPHSPLDCSLASYLRDIDANDDACCVSTTIQRRICKCQ